MITSAKYAGGGSKLPQKCKTHNTAPILSIKQGQPEVCESPLCVSLEAKRFTSQPLRYHYHQKNCSCGGTKPGEALGSRGNSPSPTQIDAKSNWSGCCGDSQERCAFTSLGSDLQGAATSSSAHSKGNFSSTIAVKIAGWLIRLYQLTLAPYLGGQCRFYPTCSQYALDALALHGFWRGISKSLLRVAKCNPFHPGGYDPA